MTTFETKADPVAEKLMRDVIVLFLNPYGQYTAEEIADFVGYPVNSYYLYDLDKEGLIQPCEVWDSENDVSLGVSDKYCLTDAGREYALSINPPSTNKGDGWLFIKSLPVMALRYRDERAESERFKDAMLREKASIMSELNQTLRDYQDLVKRNTELTRHVSKLQRQYKDLAFVVGFCVKALAAATRGFSTNAEKVGKMDLVRVMLEDELNSVDLSDGIPF